MQFMDMTGQYIQFRETVRYMEFNVFFNNRFLSIHSFAKYGSIMQFRKSAITQLLIRSTQESDLEINKNH